MSHIVAGFNNIALYRASTPTLVNNQGASLGLDVNGNLLVSLAGDTVNISAGIADQTAFTAGATVQMPVGGVYQVTPTTLTDGQAAAIAVDVNRNIKVTLATLLAGEDLTNNVIKVEERFSYAGYTTAQAAVTIKSGAGFLHTVTIAGGTAGAVTIWDNTAGSGTVIIGAFTPGNVTVPVTLTLDVTFATGLTFTTAAATVITFSYR